MLYFSINLTNPWSKIKFNSKIMKTGKFFNENKQWEFNVYNYPVIIDFAIGFNIRQSHAGGSIELGLFGYAMEFRVYDNRHWSESLNDWE